VLFYTPNANTFAKNRRSWKTVKLELPTCIDLSSSPRHQVKAGSHYLRQWWWRWKLWLQ